MELARNQVAFEQSRTRDQSQLVELLHQILINKDDIIQIGNLQEPQVEELMSQVQEVSDLVVVTCSWCHTQFISQELRRPTGSQEESLIRDDLRRGLTVIRQETGVLPPLTDLTGQVQRIGDVPRFLGGSADIWQGRATFDNASYIMEPTPV